MDFLEYKKVIKGSRKSTKVNITKKKLEYKPGLDKTFYFVGTNTFSQKFRPKQRESDATKGTQNSGNLDINFP